MEVSINVMEFFRMEKAIYFNESGIFHSWNLQLYQMRIWQKNSTVNNK